MKLQKSVLVFVLTLIAAAGASFLTWRLQAQTQTTAFAATRRETIYKIPTNEPFLVQNSEFSRKMDGSEVVIRTNPMPSGEVNAHKIVVDVPTKRRIVVDGATESVTTYVSPAYVSNVVGQLSACTTEASAQKGADILGYETLKSLKEHSLPNGRRIKVETWAAPRLGCFALRKKTYLVDLNGTEVVSNYLEVLSVTEGDPPASNFAIPPTFSERSPSSVMAEFGRRYPDDPENPNAPFTHLQERDQVYYMQQQKK